MTKTFSVRVNCPFCHHYQYRKVTVDDIDQDDKPMACVKCKKPHYVQYYISSICAYNG